MTPKPEYALSIRQPWASCIARGLKPVENRDWPTKYRGRLLVHASKTFDQRGFDWLKFKELVPQDLMKFDFPMGGIIGEATVTDCVTQMDSPWFFGKYGFLLEDARELPFEPMKGKLGIFRV